MIARTMAWSLGVLALSFLAPKVAEAQCPNGYRWSGYERRCLRTCRPGQYFNFVTGRCHRRSARYRICARGWYWSSVRRRCVRRATCSVGHYYNYSQNRCVRLVKRCGYGHYYDVYSRTCRPRCPAGWRWSGSRCLASCPPGHRFDARAGRCISSRACPVGTHWNGRVCAAAPACPRGMHFNGRRCVSGYHRPPPPPPQPIHHAPPPRPVAASMSPQSYNALHHTVRRQSFSKDKVGTIIQAARHNYFTCSQVTGLLKLVTFSRDKVRALRGVAHRIVDKGNSFMIVNVFTFSRDKRTAQAILSR